MNALEEYKLVGEARYRSYVQAVEKALKGFEYTSEWADLISALGKLNKVLQNNNKYNVIPRRITISKRLAQCMHPALPSGVHLKALETYDIIFRTIGPKKLSQELFIYTSGLFPLLGHAAMSVKPTLLTLYETHFVPLGEQLTPCLHGFLMGVLPGLEEGTDYYSKVDSLLLRVSTAVGQATFYGALWSCILTNPSIRLPAIAFIISHYNRKQSVEDQLYIIGTDLTVMVEALASSLRDASVLVQRCALDLLLLTFPLQGSQLVKEDQVIVVTAAITVVLRRDMSLNRRLFSWLMASNQNYFLLYAKSLVLQGLRLCLQDPFNYIGSNYSITGSPDLWPYRLLTSLLDRQDISDLILEEILIDIIRSLYHSCQKKEESAKKELIKTANLLFGTLDPLYLWAYFNKLLHGDLRGGSKSVQGLGAPPSSVLEITILLEFLLDIVSLETFVETRAGHLTDLLSQLSIFLNSNCLLLQPEEISSLLHLSSKLINRVQPDHPSLTHHFLSFYIKFVNSRILSDPEQVLECLSKLCLVSPLDAQGASTAIATFGSFTTASFLPKPFDITSISLDGVQLSHNAHSFLEAYQTLCKLLVQLSSFPADGVKMADAENNSEELEELPHWLQLLILNGCFLKEESFYLPSLITLLDLIALTQSNAFAPLISSSNLAHLNGRTRLFPLVAAKLWAALDHPSRHSQKAELLQQVHNLSCNGAQTEDIICIAFANEDYQIQLQALKKFCTFWHLSRGRSTKSSTSIREFDRCLFFMLDKLSLESSSQRIVSRDWLNHSIQRGDLARILEPILLVLLHPDTSRISVQHINVHCPQKVHSDQNSSLDSSEAKIYAISSVSGNVIYHVGVDGLSPSYSGSPEKKILALTSLVSSAANQVVTSPSMIQDYELPPSSCEPISFFVNPFGTFNSFGSECNLDQLSQTSVDLSTAKRFENLALQPLSSKSSSENSGSETKPASSISKEIASSIVEEIMQSVFKEIEKKAGENAEDEEEDDEEDIVSLQDRLDSFQKITVHHLHTYMLLYCQVYDSQKTIYMLSLLKSIIITNPRLLLCTMATTSISSSLSERCQQLQVLLARHRKSVYGNNFHGEINGECTTAFRSNTFIEIIVSLSLYFVRSFYPNLPQMKLTEEEVLGNRNVRLACIDLLLLMFSELVNLVKGSGKSFASYLKDLLARCKVQKTLLYCLVSNVQSFQEKIPENEKTFTETIAEFNEKTTATERENNVTDFQDTFQIHLLCLITTLVILEDTIHSHVEGGETCSHHHLSASKFHQGVKLTCQPMLLSTIVTALNQPHKAALHGHWLGLVVSSLPFSSHSLTRLVVAVASQICHSLEATVLLPAEEVAVLPADYLLTLVEGLTTIIHYCLLECPKPVVLSSTLPPPAQPPHSTASSPHNPSQIISNLIDVFLSSPGQKKTEDGLETSSPAENVMFARRTLLSHMPRILAALVAVWSHVKEDDSGWSLLGSPKVIRQHVLSFISPISLLYGSNFMAAVAVVWYDSSPAEKRMMTQPHVLTETQKELVQLVMAIKAMPLESVVQTVRQVLKQPPPTSHNKTRVPLELSILQFFLAYIQNATASQLSECWPSLLGLWRDGLQLTSVLPPVHFHLLALLHEFVQRASLLEDKKDQKDLQDIAQKLIETCLASAGASLEQTNWLWKNFSVKPLPQTESDEGNSDNPPAGHYSVQALSILAEYLAPVLDVVYVSEEKEKVVPLLTNIMYYVTPYLKDRSAHNVPSFRACSQLLASVSSYQYTRKAWKKDVLELFLDPSFFHLDPGAMIHWRSIVDHLMTHDKTTFREFLGRVALSPSGSLNLFSNKEQEFEQRAQLLKRLAFIVFCSEMDQYQRYMPEIQEKLSESLRLGQGTAVQTQVFLCFRVLLLRMSPHYITSLWPCLITELVQVFLQIEHELCTDSEEFITYVRRISALDSSWVLNSNNGLNAHNNPCWLQLYLSACKLLDVALALPAHMLPQFQMYRWAFVKTTSEASSGQNNSTKDFVPHLKRLASVIPPPKEETGPRSAPYLSLSSIQSLEDLHPFLHALANPQPSPSAFSSEVLSRIEATLERDFLESS